jgi:1-acyl-sn-glycerol-3-phosphate acyltransferase
MLYYVTRFLFRYLVLPFLGFQIEGREHIPKYKMSQNKMPFIVAANHGSRMDPWLISSCFPARRPIHWLATKELYDAPWLYRDYVASLSEKGILRHAPFLGKVYAWLYAHLTVITVKYSLTIPVVNDASISINKNALRKSLEILNDSGIIGIYPEGGLNRGGEKPLCAKLSRKCEVPILPVYIDLQEKVVIIRKLVFPDELGGEGGTVVMDIIYGRSEKGKCESVTSIARAE